MTPTTAQDIRDGVQRMMDDVATRSTAPVDAFLADLRSIHAVDPRQAVADLAHDERTEGYARRPFRTNPHD